MRSGYNSKLLANYFHRSHVKNWFNKGLIERKTFDQLLTVLSPAYKANNLFISIGLFILAVIIIQSIVGFFALMFVDLFIDIKEWIISLFVSAGLFLTLQTTIIPKHKQFRSGIDNAVLYGAVLSLIAGILLLFQDFIFDHVQYVCIIIFLSAGLPSWFYRDRFLLLIALGSFYTYIFIQLYELGTTGTLLIPFILMVFSGILVFGSAKAQITVTEEINEVYLDTIKWWATVFFYLSGNIFVVRELSDLLDLTDAFPEPVYWFFYLFTLVIPFVYIFLALKQKQLSTLNIGLGTHAIAVYSIYHYHPFLESEYFMLLLGLIMLVVAWLALRNTNKLKWNLTTQKDEEQGEGRHIESFLILEALDKSIEEVDTFAGKGGTFSGGGASGDF